MKLKEFTIRKCRACKKNRRCQWILEDAMYFAICLKCGSNTTPIPKQYCEY